MIYKRCIFLRVNIKTICFGHIWPSSGFMSIKILPNLCSEILIDTKSDDGHIWPKHVDLILTLKNIDLIFF